MKSLYNFKFSIRLSFVLLLIFANLSNAFTQLHQPERAEVTLKGGENYFTVINAKENGLVLIREGKRSRDKKSVWEVIKYDSSLHQEWKTELLLDISFEFTGYEYRNNNAYFLFHTSPYRSDKMAIVVMDLATQEIEQYEAEYAFPLQITEFTVVGNAAILGGYANYMPAIIHFDFSSKKIKVLRGIYSNRSELVEVSVDEKQQILNVIVTEKTYDKRTTLAIKTFDRDGELLQNTRLETKGENNILFGKSTKFNAEKQFIAGTYANRKSKYSNGIFIAELDKSGKQDITYISYGDLKNFFSYMKTKREARVRSRINKRKTLGKRSKIHYKLLVNDIIEKDDKYILFGEAFYPKYSTQYSYLNAAIAPRYGNRGSGQYFDGYKYTHAVVIAFNKKGKVLWDNSFEINDVTSYNLEQYVHASIEEERAVLLYQFENKIRSKIINEDEIIEGKTTKDIETKFAADEAKENNYDIGGLELWYDKYFYAYGVQKIKNLKDGGTKLNRKVFYINKIYYE